MTTHTGEAPRRGHGRKPTKLTVEKLTALMGQENPPTSQGAILQALGISYCGTAYQRLERVAKQAGIELPERGGSGGSGAPHNRGKLFDADAFREAAAVCETQEELLTHLGYRSRNWVILKRQAEELGITLPDGNERRRKHARLQARARYFFVRSTKRSHGATLKDLLIDLGLRERRCAACGIGDEWQGKKLSLHLDHIDGDPLNNLVENLQILCPNCHSQTPTYCGKNRNREHRAKHPEA